jgi:hypothetical protein
MITLLFYAAIGLIIGALIALILNIFFSYLER